MAKAPNGHDPDVPARPIKSVYYNGVKKEDVVQTNSSLHPRWAIMRAVDHLRGDHYGADRVEIFNGSTGKLHSVMRKTGAKIAVLFKDNPKGAQYEDKE